MKKILLTLALLFIFLSKISLAQETTVNVNHEVIKNNDFTKLLGGYLSIGINDTNLQNYADPNFINSAKQILPQPPANPPVMRCTFQFETEKIAEVATFCKEVNCDPMFSFYDSDPRTDTQIRDFVNTIKTTCDSVFGDTKHCRHFDIGNEPAQQCYKPPQFANGFYRIASIIKSIMPDAKLVTLELDYYSKKIQAGGCSYPEFGVSCPDTITVGECILRILDKKTPLIYIDAVETHWYPYYGSHIDDSLVNGFSILSWNGITTGLDSQRQKMTDVFTSFDNINSYLHNYEVTRNAVIGMGEVSVGAFSSGVTYPNIGSINGKWGSTFWFLDELPMMAEAGYKYVQKHVFNGHQGFSLLGLHGERVPVSYAHEFFSKYFGNRIVQTSSSNPAVLNAHSSLDKDGNLRIILVNKSNGINQPVRINLSNFNAGTEGEVYTLKIPSGGNFNRYSANETGVQITTNQLTVGQNFNYTVPSYSSVIIKVPKIPSNCRKSNGDTNGNGIDVNDFISWKDQFLNIDSTETANFNCDPKINLMDFEVWRLNYY